MKREKKWTSGEWWLSGLEIVVMPLQVKICNMVGGGNRAEARANAALISAAPELVEALERLERTAYLNIQHHLERCTCSLCQDFLFTKAALAKAYGEFNHK